MQVEPLCDGNVLNDVPARREQNRPDQPEKNYLWVALQIVVMPGEQRPATRYKGQLTRL